MKLTLRMVLYRVILAAAIVVAVIWANMTTRHVDQGIIKDWVERRPDHVVKVDYEIFSLGPFYVAGRGARIYRVTTDKSHFWFRFTFWSTSIYEEIDKTGFVQCN